MPAELSQRCPAALPAESVEHNARVATICGNDVPSGTAAFSVPVE